MRDQSSGRPIPGCIIRSNIRSNVASPARVPGGLGRGDAPFFEVALTSLSEPSEKGTIHEKEQSMTKDPIEIIRQRDAEVEQIRGFADLTEEAKERRIADVNEKARAEYAEAREADERARAERLASIKRAVFRAHREANEAGGVEGLIARGLTQRALA